MSRASHAASDGGSRATAAGRSLAPAAAAELPRAAPGGQGAARARPAAAAMERAVASRLQSQRDMLRELEELEAAVQGVANELKSRPAKSTAAQKWQFAHGVARKAPRIEAWGSGDKHVSGVYSYVPPADEQKRTGPATYQSATDPDKYLYVSMKGSWLLGNLESKEAREQKQQKGYLRSAMSVEPGVLPHMTGPGWEVLVGADFVPKETMKFWLTETVRLQWQKARVDLGNGPVIRVTGVSEHFADGLFDFVPAQSSKGEPPVFQHQRLRNVWMFLGTDQRWWIGSTSDKNSRAPHGIGHTSSPIQPGEVPTADTTFAVSVDNAWVNRPVRIQRVDGLRACDCWAEAARKTGPLELWGSSELFGAFAPEAGESGHPPVYRRSKDDGTVLFVGEDGHWWLGTSGEGGRLKEGSVRSLQSVEPGTLPDDPCVAWLERGPQEWSRAPALRFCTSQAVAAAWRAAREQAAAEPVMSLTGSPEDLVYDGLYDYIAEEGEEDGPPRFMHQINQERWVYLGADGCWWVGDKEFVASGLTKGLLCSGPVGPGDLPLGGAAQWQSWSSGSRVWVAQPDTRFGVS
ncbi:unnamed protein product [Prorocentrum cordatum]|uniref:Phospholipase B-like n=1 Tax=Prorocentrum cordatum TaxID=2364126 RepID=A0ABN9Y429_9DINO|nr:unnamed protein product [Polarella glacialis]